MARQRVTWTVTTTDGKVYEGLRLFWFKEGEGDEDGQLLFSDQHSNTVYLGQSNIAHVDQVVGEAV